MVGLEQTVVPLIGKDTFHIESNTLILSFIASFGMVTGYLASSFGLKPYPFYIGIAFAFLGFLISWLVVKDTRKYTVLEIKNEESNSSSSNSLVDNNTNKAKSNLHFKEVFIQTSW